MTEIQKLSNEMCELAKYAVHDGINFDAEKAEKYYQVKKCFWELKNKENNNHNIEVDKSVPVQSDKVFVNSFGEATKREITNASYKRQQKRLSKQIMGFIS